MSPLPPAPVAAFLNAFQPLPASGVVAFPVWPATADHGSPGPLEPSVLTRENVGKLRTSVLRLLGEAASVVKKGDGFCEWTLNEFADLSGSAFAQWVHASGRFVFLAEMEDRMEVFAGTAAHGVLCSLANAVATDGGLTTLFHFAFLGDGVTRLRSALGKKDAPLFAVAMSLADVIERSGQYDGLPSDRMSLYDLGRRQLHRLVRGKNGMAFEAPALLPKKAPLRALELTFGGLPDEGGGVLFPDALSNDGREYLSICLKDDDAQKRGEAMPLKAGLRKDLWDFAMSLAQCPPWA
jgi:hypothetical protein